MFDIKIHIFETEFKTEILSPLRFCAFNDELREQIFTGYGATPFEALHDLINKFELAEIWRPD